VSTAVPRGRISTSKPQDRGEYAAIVNAQGRREFDQALTGLLRLPAPETPPPSVSKRDGREAR